MDMRRDSLFRDRVTSLWFPTSPVPTDEGEYYDLGDDADFYYEDDPEFADGYGRGGGQTGPE